MIKRAEFRKIRGEDMGGAEKTPASGDCRANSSAGGCAASCAGESSDPDRGKAADRRYGNLPLSGKDDGRL